MSALDALALAETTPRGVSVYEFSRLPLPQQTRVGDLLESAQRCAKLSHTCSQAAGLRITRPQTLSLKRWECIYLQYKRTANWRCFVDHRELPETWEGEDHALPAAFLEFWGNLLLQHQRDLTGKQARLTLIEFWRSGRPIPGYAESPVAESWTGVPRGWSYANLMRRVPDAYTRRAARQGAAAAAAEFRAPVRLTRSQGWALGRIYVDDFWHDCWAVYRGIIVRPLQVWMVDYYTGCVPAHFQRPRMPRKDGTCDSLKQFETLCLLEAFFRTTGYSPRGTVVVVENATAAVNKEGALGLSAASEGLITIERGGIQRKRAHGGQWGPRGGGNPRSKSPIESIGNLLHNIESCWPGQMGLSPERAPEDGVRMLAYARRMLDSAQRHQIAIADGRDAAAAADEIQLPVMLWDDFASRVSDAIGRRMNGRTDHELEGWDQHIITDPATGRQRRKSPTEVYAESLQAERPIRFDDDASALVLSASYGQVRTVARGEIRVPMRDHSADDLLFSAGALGLSNGDKVTVTVNLLLPDRAFCFSSDGRFLGAAPAIVRADAFDADARVREYGRAAKLETQQLAPVRRIMAPQAAARVALEQHNQQAIDIARGTAPAPGADGAPRRKKFSLAAMAGVGAGAAAPQQQPSESATGGGGNASRQPARRFRLGDL